MRIPYPEIDGVGRQATGDGCLYFDRFRRLSPVARRSNISGFTLIELIFVIALIAIIAGFGAGRMGSILIWKQRGDVRRFTNTWQFLFQEAASRGETYRLVVDLDRQSYFVRREVPNEPSDIKEVDYLANLRTKGEKARREDEDNKKLLSEKEETEIQEDLDNAPLETTFYRMMFNDPHGAGVRLGKPIEYPSLADSRELTTGLRFRSIKTLRGKQEDGQAFIRFSPRGASEFAVVQFDLEGQIITTMMNPSTGTVETKDGDVDFEWTWGDAEAQ